MAERIPPNPLLPRPVNLSAPAASTSQSPPQSVPPVISLEVFTQLSRQVELLTAKLAATEQQLLSSQSNLTPSSAILSSGSRYNSSSQKSVKRARRYDYSDDDDEDGSVDSGGSPQPPRHHRRTKKQRKSRGHNDPSVVTKDLRRGGEGVHPRNWQRVVHLAGEFETTLRLQYLHLCKFPSTSEVEEWWTQRLLHAGGLNHLTNADPAYRDVAVWASSIAPTILS